MAERHRTDDSAEGLESGALVGGSFRVGERLVTDGVVTLYMLPEEEVEAIAGYRFSREPDYIASIIVLKSKPIGGRVTLPFYSQVKSLLYTVSSRDLLGPKSRRQLYKFGRRGGEVSGVLYKAYAVMLKPSKVRPKAFSQKIRSKVLEADGFRCRACGSAEGVQVDHILPIWEGGEPTFENGQTLCSDCHTEKTRLEGSYDWQSHPRYAWMTQAST